MALTDNHTETRNASREREGIAKSGEQVLNYLLRKGLTVDFRASNCSSPVALWRENSNAWPLSETIEKCAKAFKWSAGISLGRGTRDIEEVFAISVLAVISKPKKEKQESTRSICLNIITRSIQD